MNSGCVAVFVSMEPRPKLAILRRPKRFCAQQKLNQWLHLLWFDILSTAGWVSGPSAQVFSMRLGRWWEFIYRWTCTCRRGAGWWARCRWSSWRTLPLWWTGRPSGAPGGAGAASRSGTAESGTWKTAPGAQKQRLSLVPCTDSLLGLQVNAHVWRIAAI